MFKFSYNWLCRESETDVPYDELINWMDVQGFEIASIEDTGDDKVVEIEVKANRPDMLSVAGVLREYYACKSMPKIKEYTTKTTVAESDAPDTLSHTFNIKSADVHRYFAIEIDGVDNTGKTPEYITDALTKMGVACINPIVDVSNYVLLRIGQPIHIFDADKVDGTITIENVPGKTKFTTLAGSEIELPKGALLISDEKAPLCLAGIIGAHKPEVERATKNIIIESANFDHIIERTTSKATHVSTMASYRFERGVDVSTSPVGAKMCADLISEMCGGSVRPTAYYYNPETYAPETLDLTVTRTNAILGSHLTDKEITALLERCFFKVLSSDGETMKVEVPSFRLDIEMDVDLIEEVGRMFGYHNIEPQPITLYAPYVENKVNTNANKLRDIMTGFGFYEVLNYGFIPSNSMEVLNLTDVKCPYYGDVTILNPLSNFFGMMRPTMAYNMIATAVSNMAMGIPDVKIFEIGRTFSRDASTSTGYNEKNVFAALLTGVKVPAGFGVSKPVRQTVFDATGIVSTILGDYYNMPYEIKNTESIGFFEQGCGGEIIADGHHIGIVGKISPKVLGNFENGKLARNDVLYIELCFDGFVESKKSITHDSMFPSVEREYNFAVPSGVTFDEYKAIIKNASPFVVDVKPIDVYFGKGVEKGYAAVLVAVEYNAVTRTLEAEEIEAAEAVFKKTLDEKYGIKLKL